MNLTAHFTLEELTFSDTAVRKGLDNTPNAETIENLRDLAGYLERIRTLLGVPMHINSAYRSPKVNAAVGSSSHSSHLLGQAADFVAPDFGTPQEIAKAIIASDIPYDQIIYEGTWVHFGVGDQMRKEVLTAIFKDGKATYESGIA